MGSLKILNGMKLILDDQGNHLNSHNQFGIIQVLQRSPIPQISYWSGTFFAASYSKPALKFGLVLFHLRKKKYVSVPAQTCIYGLVLFHYFSILWNYNSVAAQIFFLHMNTAWQDLNTMILFLAECRDLGGQIHPHGARFSPKACVQCHCDNGHINCTRQDPIRNCPKLR